MDIMIIDPHHHIHPLPRLTLPQVLLKFQNNQQNLLSSCFALLLTQLICVTFLFDSDAGWFRTTFYDTLLKPTQHNAAQTQIVILVSGAPGFFSETSNELGY